MLRPRERSGSSPFPPNAVSDAGGLERSAFRRCPATPPNSGASLWARRALAVCFVWALATCVAGADAEIRIGMDTRSRPWAFVPGLDYSKEDWGQTPRISAAQLTLLQGLDIDFMKALAHRLNAVPRVVPCAWAHIEEGLLSKQFDLLINAWVPNSKTSPKIAVSSPYYEWGLVIVVRTDNTSIRSYHDLAGTRLGYFRDAVVERSVSNLGAHLTAFDDSDVLFDALAARDVDAVAEDSTYVRWRVAHDSSFRVAGEPLNRLGYFVGVRKEDTALYQKVEAAIRDLIQSGEIDHMRKRWETAADSPTRRPQTSSDVVGAPH
jgi:ABC-type amino acid transport substrate-binding protein